MLTRVLQSCCETVDVSRDVAIDKGALADFAQQIAPLLPGKMVHSSHHLSGSREEVTAYFLVLDSLNFGSAFLRYIQPYRGETGYFAIATSLRDWFQVHGIPDARDLTTIRPSAMFRIFGQNPANENLALFMHWCARALRQLGQYLESEFDGQYVALIDNMAGDTARIVNHLIKMPMFRDVALLDGREVCILKRAQIFVHDLAIAAQGRGWFEFSGLEKITIFADNVVPAVLEAHGVLHYAPELKAHIQSSRLIERQSRAEVEIRANAIVASELLRIELAKQLPIVTAREVDFALWNMAETGPGLDQYHPHRTESWFY